MDRVVLSEKEAAHYIGMSLSYLRQDRCYGATGQRAPGPDFIKIGRTVRYHVNDLDQWLFSHKQRSARMK